MTNAELKNIVKDIKNGTIGAITLIKRDIVKVKCPLLNVTAINVITGVQFGIDYEKVCNARSEEEYKAEKPNSMEWEQFPFILQSTKDSEVKYLRYYLTKNTKTTTTYYVDGEEATAEQLEIIKEWKYAPRKTHLCKKQTEHGIADENQLHPRNPLAENILALHCGNAQYDYALGLVD